MPTTALRRIGAAGIVSAVSTGALLGVAGTSSAALPSEQTLRDVPASVQQGKTVTFTGELTSQSDRPLAGEKVELEWRAGPDAAWSVTGHDQTDQNGVASIPVKINRDGEYRLRYAGNTIHDPSSSKVQGVDARQPVGKRIVEAAAAQAGDPYSYGASGPDSFDCSGLTQFAHKKAGVELPRTSDAQRDAVPHVAKSAKRPGDLVFFDEGGDVYHVGVYAGNGKIWAAPESGDVVRKQDIWTESYTVGRAW